MDRSERNGTSDLLIQPHRRGVAETGNGLTRCVSCHRLLITDHRSLALITNVLRQIFCAKRTEPTGSDSTPCSSRGESKVGPVGPSPTRHSEALRNRHFFPVLSAYQEMVSGLPPRLGLNCMGALGTLGNYR